MGTREPATDRRLYPWLVALAVGALGAWLAPSPWPQAQARLVISVPDAEDPAVLDLSGATPRAGFIPLKGPLMDPSGFEAAVPRGVPDSGAFIVEIRGPWEAGAAQSAQVRLVLADGRSEMIPLVEVGEDTLVARRIVPAHARIVLALLGFVIVLWITETIPLWVTSLGVPVTLVLGGVTNEVAALAPFFHPIIALFLGGFLLAEAMNRSGLGRRVALWIVAAAGRTPLRLYATLLAVSAFFSLWMSNTASTALLVPIALMITGPLAAPGFQRAMVLGIAFAGTIGGVGSAIGTPANPIAIEFLARYADRQVSFIEWFAVGLPLVFCFLPLMGAWLWWRMDATVDSERFAEARAAARSAHAALGPMSSSERQVLFAFVMIVALWLTQSLHGISTSVVALLGALALAVMGRIRSEDLGRISWTALLTFGGGLALGTFMTETGVSDWLATRLFFLAGMPPFVGVASVALLALALTTVASNTASAAMLVPLAIPLARLIGIDPAHLVLVVAVATSVDFALVIGTPPTMIAYAARLFSAREIFRVGIVLDLIGILLLLTLVSGLWSLMGIV